MTILVASGASMPYSGNEDFDIAKRDVILQRLPKHLDGLTIALMSDIHSGPYLSADSIRTYARILADLRADMVFLPGDFVTSRTEEVEPVCDALRTITAPFGVYGCLGNHDHIADPDAVTRELDDAGINMLRNSHAVIEPKGEKLAVIGIDDVRTSHPFDDQFAHAVTGLDPSTPSLLLCHKPYYFENAADWGVDLVVSGHTHGGQVVLARFFDVVVTPAALISGYIEGLYRCDDSQLYVTRGIGTVGLPIRWNCPPEVTLLTLRCDAAA